MLTLKRMHCILGYTKPTFQPQGVSPIDTIPTVRGYLLAEYSLPLGSKVGAEMISALLLAFETYCDFFDD
jgi:hypothetical protein